MGNLAKVITLFRATILYIKPQRYLMEQGGFKPSSESEQQLKVEIRVTDPQADSVKGFFTYLVEGTDDIGSFEIRRRFNDFFYLRESLVKIWPALYIPPIPEKKITGNKDTQNVQSRKRYFDFFFKRLSKSRYLFKSIPTQQFLRNKNIDMEKYFTTVVTPRYGELVLSYKNIFSSSIQFSGQRMGEARSNSSSFAAFLQKAQKQLTGLRQQMEIIVEARAGFTQQLNNCSSVMLPQYEKNVYIEYLPDDQKNDPNLIFANNQGVESSIKGLKQSSTNNSFASALDLITYEILQVKAMDEALKIKQKLQSEKQAKNQQLLGNQAQLAKLMGGKTTFKSIFSRGSKSEQIQKFQRQNPQLQKQIKSLGQFNEITALIFGLVQIPKFKRDKQLQYYRMMFQVSENEMKYLCSYGQFMKAIMVGLQK